MKSEPDLSKGQNRTGTDQLSAGQDPPQNEFLMGNLSFKQFLEAVPDGLIIVNTQGRIQFINKQIERMFGYESNEVLDKPVELLIPSRFSKHKEHREGYLGNLHARPMGSGQVLFAVRKDQTEFQADISLSPLETEGETYIIAAVRDVTLQKLSEKQLLSSFERYQRILNNMLEGCQIIDFDWRYIYVNDVVANQGRSQPEHMLMRHMWEVYPGIENTELFSHLKHCMENRVPQTMENRFDYPDGSTGWFELSIQPVPEGLFILSIDITERKKTQELYRILFEQSGDAVFILDLEGRHIEANRRASEMLGYTHEELLNLSARDITAETTETGNILSRLINGEVFQPYERLFRKKNGELIMVEPHITLMRDEKGQPLHILSIVRDITERKEAEEALQRSEKRFRALIERGADEIVVLDAHLKPIYMSPNIGQITGYGTDKIKAMERFSTSHPEDQTAIQGMFQELLQSPSASKAFQFRLQHIDGTWRWIEGVATNFLADPNIGGILLNYHDVTERKLSEEKNQTLVDQLTALRSIDVVITSRLSLNLTLNFILKEVTNQLKVDATDVLLLDQTRQELEFAAGYGFQSPTKAQQVRLRLGVGMAGKIALERKPLIIPDLKQYTDPVIRKSLNEREGFVSYFGMPLVAKGKVVGVLEAFHRSPLNPEPDWVAFLNSLAGQTAIAIDNSTLFDNLQRSNSELIQAYETTLEGWSAALDLRDEETEGHTQRVTALTLDLAKSMGVNRLDLVHIRRGALLHDIGKMGVPDHILLKPGKLTDEEWQQMRLHPTYAYDLISRIDYLREAMDIPYCHHEKWDGTGYPRGLKGEEIPLAARIFAVVDVWDAVTSDRPYRAAWSKEKALDHIRSLSGTHFEPKVVDAFLKMINQESA